MKTLLDFLPDLLDKTHGRKVTWGEKTPGNFAAEIGDMIVLVSQFSSLYTLSLRTREGKEIESNMISGNDGKHGQLVTRLAEAARRSARNVDENLDRFGEHLKKL
jgi:hypothetical protein